MGIERGEEGKRERERENVIDAYQYNSNLINMCMLFNSYYNLFLFRWKQLKKICGNNNYYFDSYNRYRYVLFNFKNCKNI